MKELLSTLVSIVNKGHGPPGYCRAVWGSMQFRGHTSPNDFWDQSELDRERARVSVLYKPPLPLCGLQNPFLPRCFTKTVPTSVPHKTSLSALQKPFPSLGAQFRGEAAELQTEKKVLEEKLYAISDKVCSTLYIYIYINIYI